MMPTGREFSEDLKQMMFRVILFVKNEKDGLTIPLYNVNERLNAMLGISKQSILNLKRRKKAAIFWFVKNMTLSKESWYLTSLETCVPWCDLSIGENRRSLANCVLELFQKCRSTLYFEMDSNCRIGHPEQWSFTYAAITMYYSTEINVFDIPN